ncbi:MAG: hypothetical protein MJ211_05745 [Bacteroidales bacterium]|nr:hypothetical protein [Bacteroidales bacterium]
MENNFYLGLKPYQSTDYLYFSEREDEIRQLSYLLDQETISVLYSSPKVGKTSLINAGILNTERLNSKNVVSFKFDLPVYSSQLPNIEQQLVDFLLPNVKEPSYLDVSFKNDDSLWFISKKIQARYKSAKRIYVVFDNFENFFTYPEQIRTNFIESLSSIVYGDIPEKFNIQLQKMMMGEIENKLSKEGMTMIYEKLNVGFLFVIEKSLFKSLVGCGSIFSNIINNSLELLPFKKEQAIKLFDCLANFPLQNIKIIKFSENVINYLIDNNLYENNNVNIGELRQEVFSLREYASQNNISELSIDDIINYNYLENTRFISIINSINNQSQIEKIQHFINSEIIVNNTITTPAFKISALIRQGILPETLQVLEQGGILSKSVTILGQEYYQAFDKKILNEFLDFIQKYNKSLSSENQQNKEDLKVNPIKEKRNSTYFWTCIVLAILSLGFVFLAFSLKENSEKNSQSARSNILSTFAFQKLETDPTFSLRLAQKAVQLDTSNRQAYSALLNSFYNTDIFYNISSQLKEKIVTATISNNAQYILTFERNYDLNKYNLHILKVEGKEILNISHPKEIISASMSLDNSLIITSSEDSIVRIFDINGTEKLQLNGHKALIRSVEFSSDASKMLTAGSDGNVKVWNIDGTLISSLSGHDDEVYSACFSPDGTMIATASGDNTAKIWTIEGRLLQTITINEDSRFANSILISVQFSPDGKYLLTASNDRLNKNHKARLWDLDGNELVVFSGHSDWLNSAYFSPDGNMVITSSRDHTVKVFDISGEITKQLKGHNSNVFSARFLPDNQSIVTVGSDNTIRTWSIGKRFETYQGAKNVNFACFSPNGLNLLVVQDTVAQLWDLTGEKISEFVGHSATINTAHFSPDGQLLVTSSVDGTARLWNIDGQLKEILLQHNGSVNDAIFSPNGKYIVSVSDDSTIIIKNLELETQIKCYGHSGCITSVAFSPNGESFVTGGCDCKVVIHDINGDIIRTFVGHDGKVNSVNYSPDGQYVISTSSDKSAVLWDKFGNIQITFRGYENQVNSAVFSPDGQYIVTTSDDGNASLWTFDGKDIMKFNHDGKVSSAVFSPDGKYLLTVYRNLLGKRTVKLRMLNADDINRHLDQLDLYGSVWMPDDETITKYGM